MEHVTIRAVPGAGFIASLLQTAWLERDEQGDVIPWLLIAHPPPRRQGETAETIETGLLGMADALGVAPMSENVPDIGGRLLVRGTNVALYYGHPVDVLRIPRPSGEWCARVAMGQPAVVALGLDPIPPGTGRDGIEEYLWRSGKDDRVLLGITTLRRRWS